MNRKERALLHDIIYFASINPIALLVTLFSSCENSPRYPGYSKSNDGFHYKIHVMGDGKEKPSTGYYVKFSGKMKRMNEEEISDIKDSVFRFSNAAGNPFETYLSLLVEGDSASFIVTDSLKLELKVHRVQSQEKHAEELKYHAWKNDGEMNELKKLKQHLRKKKIDDSHLTDGIYMIPIKKGKGAMVEIGNTVVVHYRGAFLDSTVFDSTYEKKEPFEFKFGDDDQVIPGLELAICQMRKGEKVKIIIPSQLAFGESGSSTGLVPPFTTVEYEIELVNLK